MHWVYILSLEEKRYYVGETTRLYKRLSQHCNEKGAIFTTEYNCKWLFAIYSVHMDYAYKWVSNSMTTTIKEPSHETLLDIVEMVKRNAKSGVVDYKEKACILENEITVCMAKRHSFEKVRGGKWCKEEYDCDYTLNLESVRPNCVCGGSLFPAEVYYDYQYDILYFGCPKKNMEWINHDEITVPYNEPCDFRLVIDKDNNMYKHGWKQPFFEFDDEELKNSF